MNFYNFHFVLGLLAITVGYDFASLFKKRSFVQEMMNQLRSNGKRSKCRVSHIRTAEFWGWTYAYHVNLLWKATDVSMEEYICLKNGFSLLYDEWRKFASETEKKKLVTQVIYNPENLDCWMIDEYYSDNLELFHVSKRSKFQLLLSSSLLMLFTIGFSFSQLTGTDGFHLVSNLVADLIGLVFGGLVGFSVGGASASRYEVVRKRADEQDDDEAEAARKLQDGSEDPPPPPPPRITMARVKSTELEVTPGIV